MKHFVFVRGLPCSGKITVGRALEKKFGWKVLWMHSIKNAIFDVIGEQNLRELMKEVLEAISRDMMKRDMDVIFVRTAMNNETVARMKELVEKNPNYRFDLVTLLADKKELERRVVARPDDPHRPSDLVRLNKYLERVPDHVRFDERELVIDTTDVPIDEVVKQVCEHFNYGE